jgi:hypothetical protein
VRSTSQRRITRYRATWAGAECSALEQVAEGPLVVPHDRDKLVVHALVAADPMRHIPAVQKKITEAEAGNRGPVDVPTGDARCGLGRRGKCEDLELRICPITHQSKRVGVETIWTSRLKLR